MAVTTFNSASLGRAGALYSDYPENIFVNPELNGRIEATEVESLAADIAKNGQITPVVIRKDDAGNPILVYGHRRWRAVKWINDHTKGDQQKIKLICNYFALTEMEAFAMAIAENRFRKDVTAVDDCHNICLLQKRFGATVEDVAAIYFPEAKKPEAVADAIAWVKKRIALQELAPEAAEAVRDGRLKLTAAVQLARQSKDQQRAIVKADSGKVKGKSRIKVAAVLAAKKPASKSAKAAKAGPVSAPKLPPTVYAAAEAMALALDVWITDATEKAEKAVLSAHKSYRRLVPVRGRKDSKAA